jgi:nitrogen PTS system EIIA component
MKLKLLLQPECTKVLTNCQSKKKVLEHIAEMASRKLPDLTCNEILTSLTNREKLGSTGIGNGVAIPHGKIAAENDLVAVLLLNRPGINYDAIDNRPVDIFCALLVPEDQCETHLKTLASIAEVLDNKEILRKIRSAQTDNELYQIIEVA